MTLAALALLGCPADRDDIEGAANEQIGPWIDRGTVVETSAGCVMAASVAETVARQLSPEQRTGGHRLAYEFLDGPVARRKLLESAREDIVLARWRHAQGAGWPEKIRKEGTLLLNLYQNESRAGAFLGVLDPIIGEQRELPDVVRIGIGWAYLTVGKCDEAISWLDVLRPDDLEKANDTAWWYMVRAEAEKSCGRPGSKQRARSYLERALVTLEEDGSDDAKWQRLRCRHDLARLTHFFERNAAGAVQQYEQVAKDWKAQPFSELDRAITIRNLAEALMDSGRAPEAETRIVEARQLIPNWTRHIVVSELEYLAGRLAIRLGLDENEISRRFQHCRENALATNHLMMAAIVEARMFWRADPGQASAGLFDDGAWETLSRNLAVFERHAWAARVLIDGRLRHPAVVAAAAGFNPRPRAGGERSWYLCCHQAASFNPRPRAGGERFRAGRQRAPLRFQSTPPRGGRLVEVCLRVRDLEFQSTPPRGGRRFVLPWRR